MVYPGRNRDERLESMSLKETPADLLTFSLVLVNSTKGQRLYTRFYINREYKEVGVGESLSLILGNGERPVVVVYTRRPCRPFTPDQGRAPGPHHSLDGVTPRPPTGWYLVSTRRREWEKIQRRLEKKGKLRCM